MTLAPSRLAANHWPGLDEVPSGARAAMSARVARRIFAAAVSRLDVTVEVAATDTRPAQRLGRGGPVAVLHRPEEFFARVGAHALIGFGEAYLVGAWDAEDLGGFLSVLAAEMPRLVPRPLQRLRALYVARPPRFHRNSEDQTRGNIAHHYDLSNDMFELFLDRTLSYSSALFEAEHLTARDHVGTLTRARAPHAVATGGPVREDLADAQARKLERLLDRTGVTEGSRVLEIGSGWGELAIRAARRGAQVTTITLSSEQQALARERVAAAGMTALVDVELVDYRAVQGTYDVVLSVEMIEAVGWQYWPTYLETIERVLVPGGRAGIQAITMPHDRMLATRNTYTWINKYIFPGGFLPSVQVLDELSRAHTDLRLTDRLSMGLHYAETLRLWDETFTAAPRGRPRPRVRRDVPADVALLPRVLPRRLRLGLPRRPPAGADPRGGPLMTPTGSAEAVATRLAAILEPFVGGEIPVRLRAWDGSEAGPADGPVVELREPAAVRRLLRHPGELGAAQAYVTGELDVPTEGGWDLGSALTHAFAVSAERGLSGARTSPGAVLTALRELRSLGLVGLPPAAPASQARLTGRLHSPLRDRRAISHHYDLSNEFYSSILEESMAYSCGYHVTPDVSLEEAQRAKLDLVCRKLGLEPGMRLLDVGCGWGSLSLHAAEHVGAQVVGVTIAAEQKRFIDARLAERGLGDRVEIRLQDYRDAVPPPREAYDAVGSLEMGEHVGRDNYPAYASVLYRAVRPGGRVLVQQMSRRGRWPGGGPFIQSFIAPDMYMRPVGETVALLEASGLEVRDVHGLREHYVLTVAGWRERFEANVDRLTELVGEEVVRVWRLYLVGGALSFRDGRMGVDQILLVRPGSPHTLALERSC